MIGIKKINAFITLLISISVILSLGFNTKLIDGGTPIYLSQLVFTISYIIFLVIIFLVTLFSNHRVDLNFLSLFFIFFLIAYSAFGVSINGASFSEQIKFSFVLVSVWFFLVIFSTFKINLDTIFKALLVGGIIACITFISEYNILDINPEKRLKAGRLGGYNAFAFILSQIMLIAIHLFFSNKSFLLRSMISLAFILFTITIFLTFSRGGLFCFLIGAAIYLYKIKQKKIFVITPVLILLALPFFDISIISNLDAISDRYLGDSSSPFSVADYSTGRVYVWFSLLDESFASLRGFVFGHGLGSILIDTPTSWTYVRSAHNQYLEYFYSFGFIIFSLLFVLLFWLSNRLFKLNNTGHNILIIGLFIQILIGIGLDSYLQTSQIGWYFGIMIAIFIHHAKREIQEIT
jgi:O-antigen ligase